MCVMTQIKVKTIFFFSLFCICIVSCNRISTAEDKTIFTDSISIANGEKIFSESCASCHSFRNDGIGPPLGGVTSLVSAQWIKEFIRDPKAVIESGDERAQALHERYKSIMPSFQHYSEAKLNNIIAFLNVQKAPKYKDRIDPKAIKDPISESITMTGLVVELREVTQIPPSSEQGQLTRICKLDFRPDTKTLYVVDLRGKLYELHNGQPKVFLDMVKEKPQFIHKPGLATGFGSFAFHPEYKKNGLLYTTHVEAPGSGKADFHYNDSIKVLLQWVLCEWKTDQPNTSPFLGKSRELFRINMVHSYHGVQEIAFNPLSKPGDEDYGLLYIGIGDGSSVEFGYPFLAHSKEKIWGTVVRIDPSGKNSTNGKYGIPKNNPFVNDGDLKTLGEIYAYGFRNPHRISWTKEGQILVSNIGHHSIEALYMVLPGHDYGWPIREGTFSMDVTKGMRNIYPLPADDEKYNITYPVAQYDHDEGNAISGGYEYWGNEVSGLKGKYIFGDIVKGRLFYIETTDLEVGKQAPIHEFRVSINGTYKTLVELCGANKVDLRFGRDHEGELYLFTKPDGKIYKMVSARYTAP